VDGQSGGSAVRGTLLRVPNAHKPPALRGRVFRKRDVVASGLLTTDALRSTAWRRLYRGIYADADLPDSFGVRLTGAALLVPSSAVFSGRTAAYLHGATTLVDSGTPVEVSVPAGVRFGPVTGLRVRSVTLLPADIGVVQRRRCTTGVRSALDIARWEPLIEAVVALDVLLARVVVGRSELREAAGALGSRRGARRAQRAIALADHRAESPPESRLRVLLALAGLSAVPQFTVRNADGDFVARVDLALPEHRVAIEYDGAWHAEPGQFAKDRRRLNALVAAGWTVVHVTAADLREADALIARIRALIATRNFGGVGL
jgi:very-short-patch-repair endonuclease